MKLNKKLIAFGLLISMLAMSVTAGAAITGVTVTGGTVDRAFDAGRTLYDVYVPVGTTPEFQATGGNITTTATSDMVIVTDSDTGIEYRYRINEYTAGDFKISALSVSATGLVTIALTTPEALNVTVTTPKAPYSETAYSLSEINGTDQESKIAGHFVIPANSTTVTYQIPAGAISGTYKFIIVADNQYKSQVEERNGYFSTQTDLDTIRTQINAAQDIDDLTAVVSSDYLALNINLAKYNALVNKALFETYLLNKNFTDNQVMLDKVSEAYALSLLNEAEADEIIQIIKDNNLTIGFDFEAEYAQVKAESSLTSLIEGKQYTTVSEFLTEIDKYIALARVNEADPSKIQNLYDNYKTELEIPQTTVDLYDLLGTKYQQAALKGAVNISGYKTLQEFNAGLLNSIAAQYDLQEAAFGTTPGDGTIYNPPTGGGGGGGSTSNTNSGDYDFGTDIDTTNHEKEPDYEKPTLEEVQAVFKDLDNHEWAHEAIMLLHDWGVINGKGDGVFDPEGSVTREEFVKMLMLAIAVNDEAAQLPFTDVNENDWFYKTVSYAYKAGITTGVTETEFGVGQAITRQDMAVMLNKARTAAGISVSVIEAVTFTDSDQIADYAKSAVEALANRELLKGSGDGSFEPNATVTRAVAAQAIYNLIKNI